MQIFFIAIAAGTLLFSIAIYFFEVVLPVRNETKKINAHEDLSEITIDDLINMN